MLKKILNEAMISFQIKATGPILIKEGDPDVEDNEEERHNIMKFIKDANGEIFIPGSSIKGVWRSWCEKIARTISDNGFPISCDPFSEDKTSEHFSCSKRFEKKKTPYLFNWDSVPGNDSEIFLKFIKDDLNIDWVENIIIKKFDDGKTIFISKDKNSIKIVIDEKNEKATININDKRTRDLKVKMENGKLNIYDSFNVYALSCPICKLFGNTSQGSRIRISDAYLIDNEDKTQNNLPTRPGIGIDRFTGSVVSTGPFSFQYLTGRTFEACVHIRNFELWQLGLLAYLFKDFEEELVPIGYGKTRGFGKVKGTVNKMRIINYGLKKPQVDTATNTIDIKGIGTLYEDLDKDNYKFANENPIKNVEIMSIDENFIKSVLHLNESQAKLLFNECAPYWAGGGTDIEYFGHAQSMREYIINNMNHDGEENA